MTEKESLELAAAIWCEEKNRTKVLDNDLAESFAEMLRNVAGQVKISVIQGILKDDPTYLRSLMMCLGKYFVNNRVVADPKVAKLLAESVVAYIFGVRYDASTSTVVNTGVSESSANADP